jgi:hypothetical protein
MGSTAFQTGDASGQLLTRLPHAMTDAEMSGIARSRPLSFEELEIPKSGVLFDSVVF